MIEQVLIISSNYVSASTWKKLKKGKLTIVSYKSRYGFFIQTEYYEGVPEDLDLCLTRARELGCAWLCLDVAEELEVMN